LSGADKEKTAVPARSRKTERIYVPGVFGPNDFGLRYQPTKLIYTSDGSSYVDHLRYRTYGAATASAVGIDRVDDCKPSCAGGTYHSIRRRVTFWRIARCRGKLVYSMFKIDAPGARRYGITNPISRDLRPMIGCPAT
jgi:hypothetical protein